MKCKYCYDTGDMGFPIAIYRGNRILMNQQVLRRLHWVISNYATRILLNAFMLKAIVSVKNNF